MESSENPSYDHEKCPDKRFVCIFKENNLCSEDTDCEDNEKCCMLGCGKKCYNAYGGTKAMCKLPMEKGSCEMSLYRWWYNSTTKTCQKFTYGGCFGNNNNFQSQKICKTLCKASREVMGSF
ncbi:eppin [Monodelphis domestica]|uniref:eppin n=1 Tax=Monodelphis domestica TaxID=13616 RepID=UPI0004432CC8|nr:eppin [Monodelphis domestica]